VGRHLVYFFWNRDPKNEWNVGDFVPKLLGKIHGKRRLGGPRDSKEDNVGTLKVLDQSAIVLLDGELDCLDSLEILV
jgi:hypothetical protein